MRDPQDYRSAGRNDPHSPQQMEEHPYDFVSLPERPKTWPGLTHDRYHADRLTGTVTLTYTTVSPLHIGCGVFETAADCGLQGEDLPVRGITRSLGAPILPGSGWKGAVRSAFEAITDSRLGAAGTHAAEPEFKVPGPLKTGRGKHQVQITDPRVRYTLQPQEIVQGPKDLQNLSPADSLFGSMGYRGRIHPGDGAITIPSAPKPRSPLQVAPLDSPQMHRLAKPDGIQPRGPGKLEIVQVEGRKFYYDGPLVPTRRMEFQGRTKEVYEFLDFVPEGATIQLEVWVHSVTEGELGALLLSAGYGDQLGSLRFGGFKSCGLGKVGLVGTELALHHGAATRQWRRPEPEDLDMATILKEAYLRLVNRDRLAELREVTTMRRPDPKTGRGQQ